MRIAAPADDPVRSASVDAAFGVAGPSPVVIRTVSGRPPALVVVTPTYRLEVGRDRPRALLTDPDENPWLDLALLGDVHRTDCRDESYDVRPAEVRQHLDRVEVTVGAASPAWARKTVRLTCHPDRVEVAVQVELGPDDAPARVSGVTLLGGRAVLGSGACGVFRSGGRLPSLFSPTPTEPVHVVRPAGVPSTLGVVGDAGPGRLHAVFSPPPLCWALGRAPARGATDVPDGPWLGLSVEAPVDELTFTTASYEPLDGGFLVGLDYEGHTTVARRFTSPLLVLRPAGSPVAALEAYRQALQARGWAPPELPPDQRPRWWGRPIFCGWGAQCARVAAAPSHRPQDLSCQDAYDEWLAVLVGAGVDPGTVVVDDRWQARYGAGTVDEAKWPDLRGWVAVQHRAGRRVLLWWKAWDPEGVPPDECVTDPAGTPVSVDVNSVAYRNRLSATVVRLLGPGGVDADGLKVDFVQRAPSGESLRAVEGPWGVAAVHALLEVLHTAAKSAKPDALVVAHTPHPSFGDVCDMVRLDDLLEHDTAGRPVDVVDQLRFRAAVVAAALPGHLVDTDQWPMPDREQWRAYSAVQPLLGVPALYYVEGIDASGEPLTRDDLAEVARSWARYAARGPQ